MNDLITRRTLVIGMGTLAVIQPKLALAATVHDVEMLNKHPEDRKKRNIFKPVIQSVEVGDSVKFIPTDKGHNSVSIKGMIPEGATPWKGKINQELTVTFEKPGLYGYFCQPHAAIGMVGLIIVRGEGMLDNLEAAKAVRQRGKAKKVWKEIWEVAEKDGLLG